MTRRGVIRLAGGACAAAILAAAGLVLWPLMVAPDPDASLRQEQGRRVGDLTGYVTHVNFDSWQVDVSTNRFGLRPVRLQVGSDTAIVVHDKQGGLGDLWKDMPVRIAYEVRGDTRLARSIEVAGGDLRTPRPAAVSRDAEPTPRVAPAAAARPPAPPPLPPAPPPLPPAPPPLPPAAAPRPSPPVEAAGPVKTPAPEAAAPAARRVKPPAPSAPVARPAKTSTTEAAAPATPPVKTSATDAAAAAPRAVKTPATEPAAPALAAPPSKSSESDTDGSAAIDWLIRQSGRR